MGIWASAFTVITMITTFIIIIVVADMNPLPKRLGRVIAAGPGPANSAAIGPRRCKVIIICSDKVISICSDKVIIICYSLFYPLITLTKVGKVPTPPNNYLVHSLANQVGRSRSKLAFMKKDDYNHFTFAMTLSIWLHCVNNS